MPILFYSLHKDFVRKMNSHFPCFEKKIEQYKPSSNNIVKTYYVSPANSMGYMHGGIDYSLANNILIGIAPRVLSRIQTIGKPIPNYHEKYLPIGSSTIVDYNRHASLVVAPTMLTPSNVSKTHNAYYATMAVLYNILVNRQHDIRNVDILLTSFCCGCGGMSSDETVQQMLDAIQDYNDMSKYNPRVIDNNTIICEPNMDEQFQSSST